MPRIARVVVPEIPHHVTQRGNRRQRVFFRESDYRAYKTILARYCKREKVQIWAYCLMPNHVHLILVPQTEYGLRRALGETHRRYTSIINTREGWSGYLWQGRFSSYPMDEEHLHRAVRYVELNPVNARICARPEEWEWSSTWAHLNNRSDGLVDPDPMLEREPDWCAYLAIGMTGEENDLIELHGRTGRPLGSEHFLKNLESELGRKFLPQKPGRKPASLPVGTVQKPKS